MSSVQLPGILNCLSGLFLLVVILIASVPVNVLQLLCVLLGLRGYTQILANLWWAMLQFALEVWSGVPILFTGDPIPSRPENAIMLGNHAGGIDFIVGVSLAGHGGMGCGRIATLMKEVLKYFPMVGWTNALQGSLFLKRNWEKDKSQLDKCLASMRSGEFPRPFWVGIYPEGTRITPAKLQESQTICREKGWPLLHKVLAPRPKGFVYIAQNLKGTVSALYVVTVRYEECPVFVRHAFLLGRFKTKRVHVNFRRIDISKVPEGEDELKRFLFDIFLYKDKMLTAFDRLKFFPGRRYFHAPDYHSLGANFLAWACLICVIIWYTCGSSFGLIAAALAVYSGYLASVRLSEAVAAGKKWASEDPTKVSVDALIVQEKEIAQAIRSVEQSLWKRD